MKEPNCAHRSIHHSGDLPLGRLCRILNVTFPMKITKNLSVAALAVSLLPVKRLSSDRVSVTESLDADWALYSKGDPSDATTDLNYTAALPWLLPMQNGFTTKVARCGRRRTTSAAASLLHATRFRRQRLAQIKPAARFWRRGAVPTGAARRDRQAAVVRCRMVSPGILTCPRTTAQAKQLYLDVDGAMAYSTVWINGPAA